MSNETSLPLYHIFYDTETTGAQPRFDQILQTAAILTQVTDEGFIELDTIDVRSRLATHIVPSAGALKVTHIDPYEISKAPYGPYEYAHMLSETFTRWSSEGPTSFDGFNTLRFDEEIFRQMLWENIHDPYITTSKGNTRNDYLHFLRALYARNPEIIDFPLHPETGKRSFKLELIAPANGFSDHNAHDALGDVRATIHVAQLIKEVDPALFEHMTRMGNANAVKDFVDTNITFRMLGGAMLNPGVLDVCLIASEAANPKSKCAWNLAVDPVPYLDLTPEEILAAMKKTGTPFRSLKCNKTPGVFDLGWEFANRVETDTYAPADAATIDIRTDIIREHTEFQKNVSEAMRLKVEGYEENIHIEQKIYSGFPSWDDKDRMKAFQQESDWGRRLDIVREFDKPELQQLGLRTIYVNARQSMPEHFRAAYDEAIAEKRHCLSTEYPWNTVGSLMAELHEMLKANPDDPELLNIRKWALETYPSASDWVPPEEQEEALQSSESEESEQVADTSAADGDDADSSTVTNLKRTVAGVDFRDGLV